MAALPSVTGHRRLASYHQQRAPSTTVIVVPQDRETPAHTVGAGPVTWTWAYARAQEAIEHGELGQDYLTFSFDDQGCCLVLCDGVSQSFYGELAAQILGDALLEWLRDAGVDGAPVASVDVIAADLSDMLHRLTVRATETVECKFSSNVKLY